MFAHVVDTLLYYLENKCIVHIINANIKDCFSLMGKLAISWKITHKHLTAEMTPYNHLPAAWFVKGNR